MVNINKIAKANAARMHKAALAEYDPLSILAHAVGSHGKPVLCIQDPYRDCFELYHDPERGDVGDVSAIMAVSNYGGNVREEPLPEFAEGKDPEDITRHFLSRMGSDYDEIRKEILVETYKEFILSIPKEIGSEVFYDYDVQCFVEDCE